MIQELLPHIIPATIEDYPTLQNMVRFYYLGDFYQRILRYWCELNQKWTMSVHRLLPRIAAEDPVFYQYLKDLWKEDYQNTALKIQLHLFGEYQERGENTLC